jgi:glycogen debranching enzyme
LGPLQQHLNEAGLGQITEVADGDPLHRPGGCFAQAWSVGELLRCLCEDVHQVRKPRAVRQSKTNPAKTPGFSAAKAV